MSTVASSLINWNQLWKIVLAALSGGTGVVIVFGVLLLCISRGKSATRPATAYGFYTLGGFCLVAVVSVAAVGVYAMTQKPASEKGNPKAATATLTPGSAASIAAMRREPG